MIDTLSFEAIDIFTEPAHSDEQWQPPLVSYSVPWPTDDLLEFLRLGDNAPRVFWDTTRSPLRLAGFGTAAIITATGPARFESIRRQASRLFDRLTPLTPDAPAWAAPRLVGGFAFDGAAAPAGLWSAFPAARFILPQFQLTRQGNESWLTLTLPAAELDREQLVALCRREIDALRRRLARRRQEPHPQPANRLRGMSPQMSQPVWEALVADATRRIRQNDLDKVVLARARHMQFERPIDPAGVLARLHQRYPDTYRFLIEPIPGHAFFGATPELLAHVNGAQFRTVAMAGSIRRGATAAEDERLGADLLANPKERHEHALVVEAIRENLADIVADLTVPEPPTLCKLSNIQHLETKIQGSLHNKTSLFEVIEGLHPTPAVGGRPRATALEIINQVEPTPRGWYAAPVGWLDAQGNGLFAVAIRSAVSVGREALLFAGAGIVADSVPANEWRETELKFKPMAEALNGTHPYERA